MQIQIEFLSLALRPISTQCDSQGKDTPSTDISLLEAQVGRIR